MGMSITEKIIRAHLAEIAGNPYNPNEQSSLEIPLKANEEIGIRIDHVLTQDATGTMVYLQFEAMGIDSIKTELAVSYVDHNTIQSSSENADDHLFLRTSAAKYGAIFSPAGNGICHQVHLERFCIPGKTLLGSDSHTPTCGGLAMLAIGAGGLDVASVMGGGLFYLKMPRIINIELKGRLKPWVSAKDIALKVLEIFTTKGNADTVFEYTGSGLANLDVPERATIANMGAECGVTSSIFPSDNLTREFLEAQQRAELWRELSADQDAKYDDHIVISLPDIEPLASAPHSPGNIVTVASLAGMRVDQVLIGSCTNSSYRDLKLVAKLLEGRKIHQGVSLGIAPGSRQVLEMLARDGSIATMVSAGARILETACGFCIGNSMAPANNAISLRTSNRNFAGRCGTKTAKVYLVSPETAVVSAIYGHIVDPRMIKELKYPRVTRPKTFIADDSMFIKPPENRKEVQVIRGPSIGKVPVNEPLPDILTGEVTIKVGDKISTDDIIPAGERLKYRSNIENYSKFVFERIDTEFVTRATKNKTENLHNFIIAGESYGQGSSREHAAMCPMFLNVKAVIARSIERIHLANLVNFGIVPFIFERKQDYESLQQGDKIKIVGIRKAIENNEKIILKNETRGLEISLKILLTPRQKQIILAGGLANYITAKTKK